jgi:hypothetical protein
MSDSPDAPKYPFQTPNQVCENLAAIERVFGKNPTSLRRLEGFDAKSHEFGNPVDLSFRDTRVGPIELRGFGLDHRRTVRFIVNRALHSVLNVAFDEIAASGMSYQLRVGDAGGYLFRYTKNDDVTEAIARRPEYGFYDEKNAQKKWNPPANWADMCAEHDRRTNSFEQEIPVFRHKTNKIEKTKKKNLLSNHSWGTAIDLNFSTNGFSPKKRFDMPPVIVAILAKHGFYWGGFYHDYMHFEYLQPPPQAGANYHFPDSHVTFPFGDPGKHESPTKYFFLNEHHGRGGYFPLGLYQNLHGGIHLNPVLDAESGDVDDSDLPENIADNDTQTDDGAAEAQPAPAKTTLTPVRAALPGYIVAARLVDSDLYADNEVLRKNLEGQPLGFVLVRHELKKPEKDAKDTWPLYSLYMHLASPKWDAESADDKKMDKQFEAAPWLEKFLRMEFGGVVALDPDKSDEFGKTFWATQEFKENETTPIPVRGREQPLDRKAGESGDRIVGYGKQSPKPIHDAIKSFKKGAVVTFDRPVLPVVTGEVIGFLDGVQTAGNGRHYLHWEIFSQPEQGLAKLREFAKDLDITLDEPLKELCEDNFLEMPSLHHRSAPDEIDPFFKKKDPVLNPVIKKARYAKKLVAAFRKGEEFAAGSKSGSQFRYTTTLKFANPYHFRPEEGVDAKIGITYLSGGKVIETPPPGAAEFGENITINLDVPAAADMVELRSPLFRLDLAPPPPPAGQTESRDAHAADKQRKSINKGRRALWKAVTGRRWRDLVVEHINEWTAQNLDKYIKTRVNAAYFDSTGQRERDKLCTDLEKALAPLTWYAPPKASEKPHGEQTATGDGSRQDSLFGADGSFLPRDGHLESMHPATTLWLVDLLLEEGKIAFQDGWKADNLIAEEPDDDPPFFGVTGPAAGTAVGAQVALALIHHGYQFSSTCKDSGVRFLAYPEDHEPRILALASYVEGAAVAKVRFPFWRKTEIKVEAQEKNATEGRALTPQNKGVTTLELPRPAIAGTQFALVHPAGGKPNDHVWTGTILVKDACPFALEGYFAFTCWKADPGKKPDFSEPGSPGTCLWPVVAERSSAEEHERDGLKFKGDFIVGVAGKRGKASPKTAHVSADFFLQDFMNKKVAEAEGDEFQIAFPLVQRLQALKDLCKARNKGEKNLSLSIIGLNKVGLLLAIASPSVPAILERASALPPSDLFTLEANPDGKSLQLTYSPLPTTASLTFTTDLGPALQQLANTASTKSGEQIFARPIFLAPNGGHHVFTHLNKPPVIAEDEVVMATADDIFSACVGDCIQLETDVVLPPAHAFGFGPLTVTMGRGSLRTTVALLGPTRDWGNAKVQITCGVGNDTITGGVREGSTESEYWYLEKWQHDKKGRPTGKPKSRWRQIFKFKVELASTKGIANPPAPVEATFDATPKLASLDIVPDEDNVMFRGTVQAIPTSSDLGILCERQTGPNTWQHAAEVANALTYQRPSATSPGMWGSPNGDMSFVAQAAKSAFALANYRFTWHALSFSELQGEKQDDLTLKVAELDDLEIAPLVSRVYTGAELGGSGSPPVDEPGLERAEPDAEVTDG